MVAAIKSQSDKFHTADFGHAEAMTQGDDDTLRGEIGPGRVAEDDIGKHLGLRANAFDSVLRRIEWLRTDRG